MDVKKSKVPNSKTLQAMEEADNNIGETITYSEFKEECKKLLKISQFDVELVEKGSSDYLLIQEAKSENNPSYSIGEVREQLCL